MNKINAHKGVLFVYIVRAEDFWNHTLLHIAEYAVSLTANNYEADEMLLQQIVVLKLIQRQRFIVIFQLRK